MFLFFVGYSIRTGSVLSHTVKQRNKMAYFYVFIVSCWFWLKRCCVFTFYVAFYIHIFVCESTVSFKPFFYVIFTSSSVDKTKLCEGYTLIWGFNFPRFLSVLFRIQSSKQPIRSLSDVTILPRIN